MASSSSAASVLPTGPTSIGPSWSKFLLGMLHQYQEAGLYCDTSIESTNGEVLRAHMCVVAAACPVLYPLMSCNGNVYTIKVPLSAFDLGCVLEYIYTGELINGPDYQTSKAFQEVGLCYLPASKWADYLVEHLSQYQKAKLLCDVTLVSSAGDDIMAHSCVLSATSKLFDSLISGTKLCTVAMETSISSETLEFMMTYLYTGRMDNMEDYREATADDGVELGFVYQEFMAMEGSPVQVSKAVSFSKKPQPSTIDAGRGTKTSHSHKRTAAAEEQKKPEKGKSKRGRKKKEAQKDIRKKKADLRGEEKEYEEVAENKPIMFACSYCPKLMKNAKTLEAHEHSHLGIKPFPCLVCGKAFGSTKGLKSHERQHQDKSSHVCDICGKEMTDSVSLRRHMRRHTEKTLYICKLCGKALTDSSGLKNHEEMHAGIKPLLCQFCGKVFHGRGNLATHERIHTGEKPYVCRFCGKAFNVQCTMRRHERIHTGDKPYSCTFCNKAFTQQSTMKLHEMTHIGDKRHACEVCNKHFIQLWDLKKHERIHSGLKPFKCDACQKSFRDLSHLKRHQKTFGGTCPWAAVKTERKGPPYICQICDKNFTKYSNLSRHRLIHSGEKPFSCTVCGKCFRQQGTLTTHEKTHLDKAPGEASDLGAGEMYMCTLCKKVFHKLSLFRIHESLHRQVDGVDEGEGIYLSPDAQVASPPALLHIP